MNNVKNELFHKALRRELSIQEMDKWQKIWNSDFEMRKKFVVTKVIEARARHVLILKNKNKKENLFLKEVNLEKAYLKGVGFYQANLEGANLKAANLEGANLEGANLTGANLTGANLTGANLTEADLTGAKITGANLTKANLARARLTGAKITEANLITELDLTGANLTEANLARASLTGADIIGANLTEANLARANLTWANLTEVDLTWANLTKVDLTGANLTKANLARANLTWAKLTEVDLTGANLTKANLTEVDLTEVDLTKAYLTGVDLTEVDLTKANLTGVDLTGVDLTKANLTGVDLTGVDLAGADLTGTNVLGAYFQEENLKEKNNRKANLKKENLKKWSARKAISQLFRRHSTVPKYRIGYPCASADPQHNKSTAVILHPCVHKGFKYIRNKTNTYKIVNPAGARILNYCSRGVYGTLIESDDQRQSIVRAGMIHDDGDSMHLALILAVFQRNHSENAPLLLFSAAVRHPPGAIPFLNARITSYCDISIVKDSLLQKYKVAVMAKAKALIILEEHAILLAHELQKKIHTIQSINYEHSDEPIIVGVRDNDLPNIAKHIGIDPYYYCRKSISLQTVLQLCTFVILHIAVISAIWILTPNEKMYWQPIKTAIEQKNQILSIFGKQTSKTGVTLQALGHIREVKEDNDNLVLTLHTQVILRKVIKIVFVKTIQYEECEVKAAITIFYNKKKLNYIVNWQDFRKLILDEKEIRSIIELHIEKWFNQLRNQEVNKIK
ncbi:pentapeptide repeat-containing protein [Candidatus Uabimicrobium amorphum]|uniref:pentapeptide repeat-containing protein n=1 Tax=Uabimicrobium amorphum TaxID=2596890 RepID=UPI0034A3A58C